MGIVVVGAGGHARVILDLLADLNSFPIAGLLDDAPQLADTLLDGVPVLGPISLLQHLIDTGQATHAALAIGDNAVRRRLVSLINAMGITLPTLAHRSAIVSVRAMIQAGTTICAGAVVNAGAHIGTGCIINTHATIDHDCVLEDFSHIAPGAILAGHVYIGAGTLVGAGATIIPCVKVGKECVVGAGATVLRDVPDGQTVAGCPARPLHK